MSPARTGRLGLWGVFGHGNYGNEATLAAVLHRIDPAVFEPVVLTTAPDAAAALHHVEAESVGAPFTGGGKLRALVNRFAYLLGSFRVARDLDAIVIVGSGGLEYAGAFWTPFEIWSLSVACTALRRPFILLNVGAEELRNPLARYFSRTAARSARYRSFRDERSRAGIVANGVPQAVTDPVVTDLVFDLDPPLTQTRDPKLVAFGVMDYRGLDDNDPQAHGSYQSRCVELVTRLVTAGYRVTLISGDDKDQETAQQVAARVHGAPVTVSTASAPTELASVMSQATVTVATRYHSLIISLIAHTPVVSVGYSEKHLSMLHQFELPGLHQDSSAFDPAEVADWTISLATDQPALSEKISSSLKRARNALDAQWPEVLTALTPRKGHR